MAVFDTKGNLTSEAASALNRLRSGLTANPAIVAELKDAGLVLWNDQPTFMAERMLGGGGMPSNLPDESKFIPDQTPRQARRAGMQGSLRDMVQAEAKRELGAKINAMGDQDLFDARVRANFPEVDKGTPARPLTVYGSGGEIPPGRFLDQPNTLGARLVDDGGVVSAGPARQIPPTARLRGGDPVGPLGSLLPEGAPLQPRTVQYGPAAPQNLYARGTTPAVQPNPATFAMESNPTALMQGSNWQRQLRPADIEVTAVGPRMPFVRQDMAARLTTPYFDEAGNVIAQPVPRGGGLQIVESVGTPRANPPSVLTTTPTTPTVASLRPDAPGLRTSYPMSIGAQLQMTGGRSIPGAGARLGPVPTDAAYGPGPAELGTIKQGVADRFDAVVQKARADRAAASTFIPDTPVDDMTLARTYDAEGLSARPTFGNRPGLGVRPNTSPLALGGRTSVPAASAPSTFVPEVIDDMTLARAYDAEGLGTRLSRRATPGLGIGTRPSLPLQLTGRTTVPSTAPSVFVPDEVIPPSPSPRASTPGLGLRSNPALSRVPLPGGTGGGGVVPPTTPPVAGGGTPFEQLPAVTGLADDLAAQGMRGRLAGVWGDGVMGGLKATGAGALKGLGVAGLAGMGASFAGGMLNTPGEIDESGLDRADAGQFLQGAGTAASLGGPLAGALIGAGVATGPVGWGLLGAAALGAGIYSALKGKDDPMSKITRAAEIAGLNPKDYQKEYDFLKEMGAGDEQALEGVRQILLSDRQNADLMEQERMMQPTATEELALQRFYADELQKITDWETAQTNALASQYDTYAAQNPEMAGAYQLQASTTRANAARNAAAAQYQALTMPYSQMLGYQMQTEEAAVAAQQELQQQLIMQRLGYAQPASSSSLSIEDLMYAGG